MRKLILLFVAAVALWPATSSAQTPLTGDIPTQGGFGLAVWGGGPVADLELAAAARGCDLDAVWLTVGGQFVGHLIGAPAFVNAAFTTSVGAVIPPGTVVVLVCQPGAVVPLLLPTPPPTGTPIMSLLLDIDDFEPGAAVLDEGCFVAGARPNAARLFDGTAGYLEVNGTVLALASSDVVVLASAEAAKGHLDLLRPDVGTWPLVKEFAAAAGVTTEQYESLIVGSFSHDLAAYGNEGVYVELDFTSGLTLEVEIVRIGNVILQVTTTRASDEGVTSVDSSAAYPLIKLQLAETQAAVTAGIDASACVPV
ncbi:MAG: hypothetical protein GEU80_06205 [Dehalococcoidia bacterium]|nr:hypothetical protein [Dehalococcoidia bacterium]